jgi:hypothetical protein
MPQILPANSDSVSPGGLFKGLRSLGSLIPPTSSEKERAALILRLLRQAAVESRASKSHPFYSIRAVAAHFSVPPTTVTRLYGQLKEEGVLGTIWGSKTVVEPTQINEEIRIKAIVGLPASVQGFATIPNYRMFFIHMQDMLWRGGFGCRLLFHDDSGLDCSDTGDRLLAYNVDLVIWLGPPANSTNTFRRLSDRGVRQITLTDGLPINGDNGFYLSRRRALKDAMIAWRKSGIRSVRLVNDESKRMPAKQRLIEESLLEVGLAFCDQSAAALGVTLSSSTHRDGRTGIIFASSSAILPFLSCVSRELSETINKNRLLLPDGAVEVLGFENLRLCFETIEFDWRQIARKVSSALAEPDVRLLRKQTIVEAQWHHHQR